MNAEGGSVKGRRFSLVLLMLVGLVASGAIFSGRAPSLLGSPDTKTPTAAERLSNPAFPDAYKLNPQPPEVSVPRDAPDHLVHPCGGMYTEPPFMGLSPLSISWVPGMCSNGYGDIAVWQQDGHSYVAQSGFALRMYHIWNVDDP